METHLERWRRGRLRPEGNESMYRLLLESSCGPFAWKPRRQTRPFVEEMLRKYGEDRAAGVF